MTDWLSGNDDSSADSGGYLGMDDPAMPSGAPTPPSGPTAVATPPADAGWLGGSDDDGGSSDGWLSGSAPQEQQTAGGNVMDGQGAWLGGDSAPQQQHQQQHQQPAVVPGAAAPAAPPQQQYSRPAPAGPPIAESADGGFSVTAPNLPQVQHAPRTGAGAAAVNELSGLVLDVEVQVEVGLGNAALTVEEFLEMGRGSVVELDTPIDAPIELKVRGRLIARGQLVSINGSYGMRIVEMLNED